METTRSDTGSGVRLDDPPLTRVWRGHDDAARLVAHGADAAPPTADAGVAGPGIRTVLTALGETTAGIARLNQTLACGVRDCADGLGATDGEVALAFRHGAGQGS